jgi:DedD protein
MNSFLEDDDAAAPADTRELTLSTGTILGIFMALVVLCGGFFGFGYKMGSRKPAAPPLSNVAAGDASSNFTDFQPAAGSADSDTEPAPATPKPSAIERKEERAAASEGGPETATRQPSRAATPAAVTKVSDAPASGPAAAPSTGTFFVQVAAVSHEEDAQLLIHALKAKGYPVGAHTQPQDKFYHVQVGPFDTRTDAEAAKQKLITDGYQPIIK